MCACMVTIADAQQLLVSPTGKPRAVLSIPPDNRQHLALGLHQYLFTIGDPAYQPEHESAANAVLRPLLDHLVPAGG